MPRVAEQNSCENPKVSVNMITYNHEKFIAQAIASVLMQEADFPVELIIGEDCSTDCTRRIVEEYAQKYPNVIRPILPERNMGASNNALAVESASRGQYIACLEGDDYWVHPQKLQRQVQLMEANPGYSMCGSTTRIVACAAEGGEKEVGLIQPKSLKSCYDLMDFLSGYPMHTSSAMFRRGLVVFPSWVKEVINRDSCVFALHAEKGPVGYITEVTSCYRLHAGGIWIGKSALEKTRNQQKTFDFLNGHFGGRYRHLIRRWEYRDSMATSRTLIERGMTLEARRIYRQAVPRLAFLMPLRILIWGFAVYGGYFCQNVWNRLKMYLAIRTRLRRMAQRLGTITAVK